MEEPVRIDRCNNIGDFRSKARRRLPGPIFHYIGGAADDEVTYRRNTQAYERCDLVPNVLAGVAGIDMSITVMGQKIEGLQGIEWAILGGHSGGSMQVSTL